MASTAAFLWVVFALCVACLRAHAHMDSSFWGHRSDDPFPALVGTCVSNVDDDLSAVEVYVEVAEYARTRALSVMVTHCTCAGATSAACCWSHLTVRWHC